jgi:tetratricopeptide (TPR) repeat protein
MEALKKAEEAKRQIRQSEDAVADPHLEPSLSLEPIDLADPARADTLREPSLTPAAARSPDPKPLDLLDQDFIEPGMSMPPRVSEPVLAPEPPLTVEPQRRPPPLAPRPPIPVAEPVPATAKKVAPEQEAAQQLFEAKHPAPSRKNFALAAGLFGMLGVAAVGIYFWLQLQPKGGLALNQPPVAPRPTTPLSAPAAPVAAPQTTPAAPAKTEVAAARTAAADDEEDAPAKPAKAETPHPAPAQALPASPVRITTTKPRLDPALEQGYGAYQRGEYVTARLAYEQALRNDPANLDALHGLAAIALNTGHREDAESYYQQALTADPKDAIAMAGLSGLREQSEPAQAESRLKSMLAEQPNAAHLNFALGNLQARQGRWNDAQQAYFRAMTSDPENPDYLINLAISLDRLHQTKLAAQYYSQALAAAEKRPAGFDKAQIGERLKKLQP